MKDQLWSNSNRNLATILSTQKSLLKDASKHKQRFLTSSCKYDPNGGFRWRQNSMLRGFSSIIFSNESYPFSTRVRLSTGPILESCFETNFESCQSRARKDFDNKTADAIVSKCISWQENFLAKFENFGKLNKYKQTSTKHLVIRWPRRTRLDESWVKVLSIWMDSNVAWKE